MKGIVSGIKRMEIHDGDGLRTTVFLKGCPLKCIWCHNPESISFKEQTAFFKDKCIGCGLCKGQRNKETANLCPVEAICQYGKEYTAKELVDVVLQDELFFKNGGGGVTLSGGECLAQPDFVLEVAKLLKERGINLNIDTCGFVKREVFEKIMPYTDVFLYDIKAFDEDVHIKCTGQGNKLILDNLKFLSENGAKIEIRYPLVKGFNDSECEKIALFLKDLKGIRKIKVLKYHSLAGSRYEALSMENTLPKTKTEEADMEIAVNILKEYGLNAINGSRED